MSNCDSYIIPLWTSSADTPVLFSSSGGRSTSFHGFSSLLCLRNESLIFTISKIVEMDIIRALVKGFCLTALEVFLLSTSRFSWVFMFRQLSGLPHGPVSTLFEAILIEGFVFGCRSVCQSLHGPPSAGQMLSTYSSVLASLVGVQFYFLGSSLPCP